MSAWNEAASASPASRRDSGFTLKTPAAETRKIVFVRVGDRLAAFALRVGEQ